jgi:hypothetical protein
MIIETMTELIKAVATLFFSIGFLKLAGTVGLYVNSPAIPKPSERKRSVGKKRKS